MKIPILSLVVLVGIIFESCGVSVKKELKKAEEMKVRAYQNDTTSEVVDWETFNNEARLAIKEREAQIEEVQSDILEISKEKQNKAQKVLDTLAQKNKKLKLRLVEVNAKLKANMEQSNVSQEIIKITFEKAFVQDMNELLRNLETFWNNKY